MAWQAEGPENTLSFLNRRHTQTQRTKILDRIYRMSRMGCKDRWKPRSLRLVEWEDPLKDFFRHGFRAAKHTDCTDKNMNRLKVA